MSFWLLFYQSIFVSSIWCRACWPLQYYLYMQLYHEMALCVTDIAKLTLNVLDNGDATPCPFLWSSGVKPVPALVLRGWMIHCSCLCISQSICVGWADVCALSRSLCPGKNSKQSNGVEPFGGLLMSTLDDFLRSDCNYLQLPRLLSKFKSIDHEENISSCIAWVVALWGTFENCPVGGGKLDPCSLILIWDTGASYGWTPFCSEFIDYVE